MVPVIYKWNGQEMVPLDRFRGVALKQFLKDETYCLKTYEHRSEKSHDHYFAALHEAWLNLPEHFASRFATDEHLRKYLLIKTGFSNERAVVFSSEDEANRAAAFMRPMDEFAIVMARGRTVYHWTAKSQSLKAMGKADFQASKQATLEMVCAIIGITVEKLTEQSKAKAAA